MKKIGIIIFVIVIIGVLFLYFFLPEKKVEEKFEPLNITDERVLSLYEMANPSNDYSSLQNIYQKRTFTNEFILGSAFVSFLKEHKNHTGEIKEEEISQYVKKIFGNINFAHTSGFIVADELCKFKYNKNKNSYDYSIGCASSINNEIKRKLISAKKSATEYILTEKMIVIRKSQNEEEKKQTIKIYKDIEESVLLKEITLDTDETLPDINLEDYIENASTYEYHFKFDGENFIYQKLEKVD